MSCDAMLEQLLDADLDALEGRGDTPVARHVRECSRCGAVARHLVAETRALRGAVAAEPVRRASFTPLLPLVGLAAAAAALFVLRPAFRRDVARPVAADQVASAAPVPAPRIPSVTAAGPGNPAPPRTARSGRRGGSRLAAVAPAYHRVPEVVATRWEARPVRVAATKAEWARPVASVSRPGERNAPAARRPDLVVDPAPGTRALVMQTADPKVTVVWLY